MTVLILAGNHINHYGDVIMGTIASQITSLMIVYSTVYSDVDQRKHQSSASLAFVRGNRRGPVNSLHKWPVTRKMFPFDDFIMFHWRNLMYSRHMTPCQSLAPFQWDMIRGATIQFSHNTINIMIESSWYDTYLDTYMLLLDILQFAINCL